MTHIDNRGKWYDIRSNKICDCINHEHPLISQFDESLSYAIYGGMSIMPIQLGFHKSSNSFQCDFEFFQYLKTQTTMKPNIMGRTMLEFNGCPTFVIFKNHSCNL